MEKPAGRPHLRERTGIKFTETQLVCRLLAAGAVIAGLCASSQLDAGVESLWQYVRQTWWFRNDTCEPVISVLSFFFFIGMWRVIDRHVPSLHKYRIQKSEDLSCHEGSMHQETLWYLTPLLLFDFFYPRRQLPVAAPSFLQLSGEVAAGIVMYDFFFFGVHYCVHKVPFLFKNIHARHHLVKAPRACEAAHHTVLDGWFNTFCSIAALSVVRAHPLSRAVYDIVIVSMLCELHCGYDMPWMLHNILPQGLMGGPPRHDDHHRRGTKYFQKFGTYLDWMVCKVSPFETIY
jgi:hypothetical protein